MPSRPDSTRKFWVKRAQEQFNCPNAEAFAQALETGENIVFVSIDEPRVNREAGKWFQDVEAGKVAPKEAMAQVNRTCQQMLDDYWARQGSRGTR